MKICGIYKITSPTNCVYVGQSIDIHKRWEAHKKLHKSACKNRIYRSLMKHGVDSHRFEIIEMCMPERLDELENYWITHYNTFNTEHGLNLKDGGRKSKASVETRKKMSVNNHNRGKKLSEQHKLKFCYANKGKKRTKEQLITLRNAHLGIKLKKESIEKRTNTRKLTYKYSEETKRKTSDSVKKSWEKRDKHQSDETKKKISEGIRHHYSNIAQERMMMIF